MNINMAVADAENPTGIAAERGWLWLRQQVTPSQVPNPHCSIHTSGNDAMAVRAERGMGHAIAVPQNSNGYERLMAIDQPNARRGIKTSRYQKSPIGAEFDTINAIGVLQCRKDLAGGYA